MFVSAIFGGKPRQVIDRWPAGQLTLCVSNPILDEYTAVMGRFAAQDPELASRLLSLFRSGAGSVFAAKTPGLPGVTTDPDDDQFIECAVALDAACIVSGDQALLDVGEYVGIRILTPAQFLEARGRDEPASP